MYCLLSIVRFVFAEMFYGLVVLVDSLLFFYSQMDVRDHKYRLHFLLARIL